MTLAMRWISAAVLGLGLASPGAPQDQPLRLEITEAVLEPMPIAIPYFADQGGAAGAATDIPSVIADNLGSSGLFRVLPRDVHLANSLGVQALPALNDWRAVGADALVAGETQTQGNDLTARFRIFDLTASTELGDGMGLTASEGAWRRLAHKISDQIYSRITGEGPYFDTRIVFVAETGPKGNRAKRLAIMDQDGANLRYLTSAEALVLAPRFSPDGRAVIYTSYAGGQPEVRLLDLATLSETAPARLGGEMSFSPRFAPDGRRIVFSAIADGNTDIFTLDLTSGARQRLTTSTAIDTAPSFSPDGRSIVFESDRGGNQALWVMPASGGEARRISNGAGRYATPVWSPRGDLIAFTKQQDGQFHIGVMRIDGSGERLLTQSFLEEGPSWSPNGRVIIFTRETGGEAGQAALYTVDISGRNLRRLITPDGASDPSWSPVLP